MYFAPVGGPVRVLGAGLWNDEDPTMGRYVDVYDADEGDVIRCSVEKGAGDEPVIGGDVVDVIFSTRAQAKVVGIGDTARAIEKTQLRIHSYRVVGRLVMQAVANDGKGEVAQPKAPA